MAKRFRDRHVGSWANGSAPAQGSAGVSQCSDGQCASGFLSGIDQATSDPIKQYQVPTLGGSTVCSDMVCSGVWGRSSKKP